MYTNAKIPGKHQLPPGLTQTSAAEAFSLVEVTMAMGLVSFCLVAMLGVLPVGLMQERKSFDKMSAMQVLATVESDFRSAPANTNTTTRYAIPTGVGEEGVVFVDNAFERTEQQADAEFSVRYRVSSTTASDGSPRMHVFIARALPSAVTPQSLVAEGIVQGRQP